MMTNITPQAVIEWLDENGFGAVTNRRVVGGGCINNGARLHTISGETFFIKTNTSAPEDMFECESEGLKMLQRPGGPRLPQPYLYDVNFLLLEDLTAGVPRVDYWSEFGRRLAVLHKVTAQKYGLQQDNYIGSTPQPNPLTGDGFVFFGQHRLLFQARLARERGLLSSAEMHDVGVIVDKLPDLVPDQPASLIHGDLWSGNAITDENGAPAIIDPAAHYGWAEAELAMTTLFGSFPDAFFRSYEEERPLEIGYRSRYPIYNLYHLLNHLNIFGSGYHGHIVSILRRYC